MTTDTNLTVNDITYCFKEPNETITTNVKVKQFDGENKPKNIIIGYSKMPAKDTNDKTLVWHKETYFEVLNKNKHDWQDDVKLIPVSDQNEIDIIERISNEYLSMDKNQMLTSEQKFELKWKQ